MTKRIKPKELRKMLSRDLLSLAQILKRNSGGVVINPDVLASSAAQCLYDQGNQWSYQIANLQLRVRAPQNVLPRDAGAILNIFIDLDIEGHCDLDLQHSFNSLILDIKIENEERTSMCSWHFDRHIYDDGDEETEAHPLYHFQHGGNQMDHLAEALGGVLLLPAPRMAGPPMDAILCIDYILSNFAGEEWRNLRDDFTYKNLLKETQLRLWKPYVDQLASWWSGAKYGNAETARLWPQLV